MASKLNLQEIESTTGSVKIAGNVKLNLSDSNDFMDLPSGTSDQRGIAEEGSIRWNYDYDTLEIYNGTTWKQLTKFYDGNNFVKSGLVFSLDSYSIDSYPGSGTSCYGLTNPIKGSLLNGASVNSDGFFFDGSNGYITLGSNALLRSIGNTATIECWFKSTDVGSSRYGIMVGWGDGTSFYSHFGIGNWGSFSDFESIHVGLRSAIMCYVNETNSKYHDGNWHHAVATLGPNNYKIYVDTEEKILVFGRDPSYSETNIFGFSSVTEVYIGLRPYGNGYFKGNIPVVNIYDRVLSEEEILQNYNAVRDRFGV
jgi:hypothetical protein